MIVDKYNLVIGLEVHVELKTKSKMFCGCSADYFGKEPNTHVCPVCLGLPGALPAPNKTAIEWCVMIGLALNCKIPLFSKFDRKNYFYPDLPKGYQISQYDQPFCVNGWIEINPSTPESPSSKVLRDSGRAPSSLARMTKKRIRIRRVHMEEDTAKLMHQFGNQKSKIKKQKSGQYSLIDFNRSGVPLVEIVSEPDFESATEVAEYLKKLQQIVRYLEVSDTDMEKGEMRLEPNISLRSCHPELVSGSKEMPKQVRHDKLKLPNYKVEIKNINSFRFVEKAINYEIERQKKILELGKIPIQETRGWDEEKGITVSQRTKEEAMDYRYFPEPDVPPIRWKKHQILNIKSQIPELPDRKFERFIKQYNLPTHYAEMLSRDKKTADYFEEAVKVNHELRIMNHEYVNIKIIANWIINKKVDINKILPAQLIQNILTSIRTAPINVKIIKDILEKNKKAVADYRKGKTQVIGFLIGAVKKEIKKSIDTNSLKETIENLLKID